jgi:hypothetical protein
MKKAIDLSHESILSTSWSPKKIKSFLIKLEKDTVFGYSGAFTYAEIEDLAGSYGIKVKRLPLRHPLRKKYGDYILKISKSYIPEDQKPIRVYFDNVHHYERKIARGNRKCHGGGCCTVIQKGQSFISSINLIDLPSCRKVYKEETYCIPCAKKLINFKVKALKSLIPGR